MNRAIFIMTQFVSWFTTGAALAPLFISQVGVFLGETPLALALGIGLSIGVTSIIQACLTLAWIHFHEDPWRRPATLIAGVAMSLTSGVFAGASWTTFTESTVVERQIHDRATARATTPLWAFSEMQASVAAEAEYLAAVAGEKKRLEESEGGSCLGDDAVRSCGVKCRLRRRQATLFTDLASNARDMSDEATKIAGRFDLDADDDELAAAFVDARRLTFDPRRVNMVTRLQAQLRGFRNQWRDPEVNTAFVCRDPEMVDAIEALIRTVEEDVDFPDAPPRKVELQFFDSLDAATSKIARLAVDTVTGEVDEDAVEDEVAFGLAIGLAIELLIIWLIALDMSVRREKGEIPEPLSAWLAHGNPMTPHHRDDCAGLLDALRAITINANGDDYLAAPVDGDAVAVARFHKVAERLGLQNHRAAGDAIDLAAIDPEWVTARAAIHGGATRFRLFRINERTKRWRRRAAQDLAAGERPDDPEG